MSKNQQPTQTIASTSLEAQLQNIISRYPAQDVPNPLNPDFEEPKRYKPYTQIEEGDNSLRILSEGIFGVEYWSETIDPESKKPKNKPTRRPPSEAGSLETDDWSYFYAFFVWNYKTKNIEIFNTAKRGIVKGLRNIINNQKWGDITQYDICITRRQTDKGDPKSVEYSVTPEPKTVLDPKIAKQWEGSGFNRDYLFLLFDGLDPFEVRKQQLLQEQTGMSKEQELAKNLRIQA